MASKPISKADAAAYFKEYGDVAEAYEQYENLYTPEEFVRIHYDLHGKNEKRIPPNEYLFQNPDVAKAYVEDNYGMSPEDFVQAHYLKYGQKEKREAPDELDQYFIDNPDVARAYAENDYGLTPTELANVHYERYGQKEEREAPSNVLDDAEIDDLIEFVNTGSLDRSIIGQDTVTGDGVDTVTGGGVDTVTGGGVDTVTGDGVDTVTGGGVDTVTGGGVDTVTGGGVDTVTGGGQDTLVGESGVDLTGSSGLRDFYLPYVEDNLEKMSALINRRKAPGYEDRKFGTHYGKDTADALKGLYDTRAYMLGTKTAPESYAGPTAPKFDTFSFLKTDKDKVDRPSDKYIAPTYTFAEAKGFKRPTADNDMSGISALDEYIAPTYTFAESKGFKRPTADTSGVSGLEKYTPYKYSFASSPTSEDDEFNTMASQPLGKRRGGLLSLMPSYADGGTVTQPSATTPPATTPPATITRPPATQPQPYTAQTVPSTFTAPTTTYSSNTYSSGYTDPTNLYKGPGDTGITTEKFNEADMNRFINPYTSKVIDPALREAKRQAEIARQGQAARFAQAGAFGGSRSAIMEAELARNLATQLGDIYGKGQKEAFDTALKGFESEQGRLLTAATETERAKQAAGQQALTSAEAKTRLGLQAADITERSKQQAALLGLDTAKAGAEYNQRARELQQKAEEAAARGDQFGKELALNQLKEQNLQTRSERELQQRAEEAAARGDQFGKELALNQLREQNLQTRSERELQQRAEEAAARGEQFKSDLAMRENELTQRAEEAAMRGDMDSARYNLDLLKEMRAAAESDRTFESAEERNAYLDPFRELLMSQQMLTGLPFKAGDTGISPQVEAYMAALGLNNLFTSPNTKTSSNTKSGG